LKRVERTAVGMTKSEVPDLSIVIPSWNHKAVLGECLRSIYDGRPRMAFQIIVVDNGSEDQTCEFLAEGFPEVRAIRNPKNLGFARASNQGIQMAEGRYVLLLNNDTRMREGTLDRLVEFMDAHPDAGVGAPTLFNPDGTLQMSACMDYTNLKYAFFGGEELPFPLNRFVRPMVLAPEDYDRVQEVAWMAGTCMIVRKEILADVGLLDEEFFMYLEDMEWCYRFRRKGWRIFMVPDTSVVHRKHHSSRGDLGGIFRQDYLAKRYFIRKHRSRRAAVLFPLLTLAGSLIKLPLHSARLLPADKGEREAIRYKIEFHWHTVKAILGPLDNERHRSKGLREGELKP
jgi:GT2 family glycosyltransferase